MFEGCSSCCLSIILIPLLCLGLVACVVIYAATSDSDAPASNAFKPSLAEAQAFDRAISDAITQARSQGWWALKFTERDISSGWLEGKRSPTSTAILPSKRPGQPDDGEMRFYADVEVRFLSVPLKSSSPVTTPGRSPRHHQSGRGGASARRISWCRRSGAVRRRADPPFADLPGSYFVQQSLIVDNGT